MALQGTVANFYSSSGLRIKDKSNDVMLDYAAALGLAAMNRWLEKSSIKKFY